MSMPTPTPAPTPPFTVATWNVNGIRARHAQFAEWVSATRPDVICLQEIKATAEQVPQLLCNLEGYHCYWHGAGGYSGVALHLRKERFPAQPTFSHPGFDRETRVVEAQVGDMVIASVYVPNGGRDLPGKMTFLGELERHVSEVHARGASIIVCGDLNVAHTDRDVHPKERKKDITGQTEAERALLSRILDQGLVDVGRQLAPDDEGLFTWWAPWRNMRQRNIGWRIDYILASRALAARATACRVLADVGTSDHAPVIATFGN